MGIKILGWEDLLEEDMASQCSVLAWKIPWTEEPGATVHGVAKSCVYNLATKTQYSITCKSTWLPGQLSGNEPTYQCRRCEFDPWIGKICWRRKWQRTPLFLSEKSHGQRSLTGHRPRSCQESDMTE